MGHMQEIEALQRWVYTDAGLTSMRLTDAPPVVTRPVILWETPRRSASRFMNRYDYMVSVQQFGKLYVHNLDQLSSVTDALIFGLHERENVIPVFLNDVHNLPLTHMKNVRIEFRESTELDVPFTVSYDVVYSKTRPEPVPHATDVHNTITMKFD